MNDDLIIRQAVIDMLDKWILRAKHPCNKSDYNSGEIDAYESVVRDIVEIPPAEPEQKWIPVSERLPEDTERYLVTLANGNIDIGWIRGDEYLWDLVDIDCEYFLSDKRYQVIAWMPLPEPYKEAMR